MAAFFSRLHQLFANHTVLDPQLLAEIKTKLLEADVGTKVTGDLITAVQSKLKKQEGVSAKLGWQYFQEELEKILDFGVAPFAFKKPDITQPMVLLMVGVNGVGKTTTIGKLAHYFQRGGHKLLLAAGDTFRAAAVEQLKLWGVANNLPVISQPIGADSAAVIYDALQAAKAREIDLLLVDTAGRLHTQGHLMAELKKIKRTLQKIDNQAPHETWLVLDATIGQNMINQVREFNEAIGITGLIITKLDGSAKGGAIFAVAQATKIPIRFIGVGEKIGDLELFDAKKLISSLLESNL